MEIESGKLQSVEYYGEERFSYTAKDNSHSTSGYIALVSGIVLLAAIKFEFNKTIPLVVFAVSFTKWFPSDCNAMIDSADEKLGRFFDRIDGIKPKAKRT